MKVCSMVDDTPDTLAVRILDQCTEQTQKLSTLVATIICNFEKHRFTSMKAALIAYLRKCVAATHLTHLLRETLSNEKIDNT